MAEETETLDETIEEVSEDLVEEVETPEAPEEKPTEKPTETRDILEDAMNDLKDPDEEEAEEVEEEVVEEEDIEEEPEEEPKPERNKWSAWKKDAQAELNKLPENVQDMIQAREEQFHNGLSQYKEAATYAKTIQRAFAPHNEYLNSINVAPEVAITTLIAAEKSLRVGSPEQRTQSFLKLAHDYGVNIEELSQVPFNPQLHELEKELKVARQQVSSHEYSQQEQVEEQAGLSIDEFAQSHEHFDSVRQSMGDLMDLASQRNQSMTLEEAYEKAVRLDDSIFEKFNAQRQEQSRKNQLLKSTQAAKVAKGAAVQVKGSPSLGGVSNATPPKTTEEAVRRAMADAGM